MSERLKLTCEREALSLITNITYTNVSNRYDITRRDLHMDLVAPKNRVDHAPCPTIVWFCGGAFRVMDRSAWMPEMMRYAEAGFVVASGAIACLLGVTGDKREFNQGDHLEQSSSVCAVIDYYGLTDTEMICSSKTRSKTG